MLFRSSTDRLLRDGLLTPDDLADLPDFPTERVDFGPVIVYKRTLLRRAYARFAARYGLRQVDEWYPPWLADFALFIRGERFDFNQPQFISRAGGQELSDHTHIHEPHYDVAHVHLSLTTWDEFLTSLGFRLTDPSFPGIDSARTCMTLPDKTKLCNTASETWKFIANGVPVDGMSNVDIADLSRIVFSYGPETVEQVLADQWPKVGDEACILSELCIARIDPNAPPEECQGGVVCSK